MKQQQDNLQRKLKEETERKAKLEVRETKICFSLIHYSAFSAAKAM